MNCVICGDKIVIDDGYLEKHLGVSGYSAVYHEWCYSEAIKQSEKSTACPECGGATSAKCFDMACPNYGG